MSIHYIELAMHTNIQSLIGLYSFYSSINFFIGLSVFLHMYTLLSGLYQYLTQKEEYYVLIIGLDNAGKTVTIRFQH